MSGLDLPYTRNAPAGQNGRVVFLGETTDRIPGFATDISVEKDFQNDMLRGNWEKSELSAAFFSAKNVNIIQNLIRKNVFDKSQPKGYMIDNQSVEELKMIMRAMYLQYARNLPTDIPAQVNDLNHKVVDWAVPHILSAVDHYFFYINDISHMPVPLQHMQHLSSAGTKTLPMNPFV